MTNIDPHKDENVFSQQIINRCICPIPQRVNLPKKVLMISFFYEPTKNYQTVRLNKFIKYLPKFKWEPIVLTKEKKNATREIDVKTNIFRSFCILLKHHSTINSYSWIPSAVFKAKKIIKREKIDLIYVTCPPYPPAIIGAILKKITKKTLILDFRDAWTFNPYHGTNIFNKLLEFFVLKNTDFLITTTKGTTEEYLYRYKFLKDKIVTIYNGFDMDDFPQKNIKGYDIFTITYTGSLHGTRSLEILFKAIEKTNKRNIQILIVGLESESIKAVLNKYNLQNTVKFTGVVHQKKAIEYLCKSHLLFLIQGATEKRCIPIAGKTFEYLNTGKPLLAILPDGDNVDLIRKYSDNSYIINSFEINDVSDAIDDCYIKWELSKLDVSHKNREEFEQNFNRKNLTMELVDIFERAIKIKED